MRLRTILLALVSLLGLSACVVAPPSLAVTPPRMVIFGGHGHHHQGPPLRPYHYRGHGAYRY